MNTLPPLSLTCLMIPKKNKNIINFILEMCVCVLDIRIVTLNLFSIMIFRYILEKAQTHNSKFDCEEIIKFQ